MSLTAYVTAALLELYSDATVSLTFNLSACCRAWSAAEGFDKPQNFPPFY